MRITPLGDTALVVELGTALDEATLHRVQAACRLLETPPLQGVTELVPAFNTITLFYDPKLVITPGQPTGTELEKFTESVRVRLRKLAAKAKPDPGPVVEIPICYGGPFGPDLDHVAVQKGLTPEEVARRHSSTIYLVYLIGFSPGFPYLGELPLALAVPRRDTPRVSVPPGSVGIANRQTCIYPMATPGGWNLIGRTPLQLFRWDTEPPSLLRPGDRVKFRAISPTEFARRTPSA